jgi:DNA-binding MarR family transcriptional regulator
MPENTQLSSTGQGVDRDALRPPAHNTTDLLGRAWSTLGHQIVDGVVGAGYPQRPAHSGVFAHIDLDGTRLTDLAARANMTPQAMGELVDDLERLGYVRRRPDPSDRRAKLIVPTALGYGALQAAFDTIGGIEQRLEDVLGLRKLADLRKMLVRIIERAR